jgi:hypothetical protein
MGGKGHHFFFAFIQRHVDPIVSRDAGIFFFETTNPFLQLITFVGGTRFGKRGGQLGQASFKLFHEKFRYGYLFFLTFLRVAI